MYCGKDETFFELSLMVLFAKALKSLHFFAKPRAPSFRVSREAWLQALRFLIRVTKRIETISGPRTATRSWLLRSNPKLWEDFKLCPNQHLVSSMQSRFVR